MNISKYEQRVLHVLAQGGRIAHRRQNNRVVEVTCYSREGHVLTDLTLPLFLKLKKRGLISSRGGGAYRITLLGRQSVRSQVDNR